MKKASALADALRAIDGARTRGLDLGKVALYQLSYARITAICTRKTDLQARVTTITTSLGLRKLRVVCASHGVIPPVLALGKSSEHEDIPANL